MARTRTAAQKAALRKAQLASARKRKRKGGPKAGKIYRKGNAWVRKGKTPARRMGRGAALVAAGAYTPYGYAYIGSGIRNARRKKKAKKRR